MPPEGTTTTTGGLPGDRTLLANEHVVLVERVLRPGQRVSLELGALPSYALSHYTIMVTSSTDGDKTREISRGDAYWLGSEAQTVENVGHQDARYLVLSRTAEKLPECSEPSGLDDLASAAPERATLLLDTDDVKILALKLEPADELPPYQSPSQVVYPLSAFTLEFGAIRLDRTSQTFEKGKAYWYPCGLSAGRIASDRKAELVVFELLR